MTNETNQTAVDIAFQKLASQGLLITRDYKNLVAYREAKEMEKEQMIMFPLIVMGKYRNGDVLAEVSKDAFNEKYGE